MLQSNRNLEIQIPFVNGAILCGNMPMRECYLVLGKQLLKQVL